MDKLYDATNDRLVFVDEPATKEYWDRHWKTKKFRESVLVGGTDHFVSPITKKFLPPYQSTKLLEGGCGRGNYVYSLARSGYDVYGIDYAKETVRLVNRHFPELKITAGDVRKIPFPDKYFDGYWSLGVIEHFFDGYDQILAEMERVIKPGGYLFLVFPYISPLRRLKIIFNRYLLFQPSQFSSHRFYQFVFNDRLVVQQVAASGFRLRYRRPYDGFKGFKDEVGFLKSFLQRIYDRQNAINRLVGYTMSKLFAPFASHVVLLVFERTN